MSSASQHSDDDPDARIWLVDADRYPTAEHPEYLPEARDPEADRAQLFGDDEQPNWHHGELWLGTNELADSWAVMPDHGYYAVADGAQIRKPLPNDAPLWCAACSRPTPVDWSWSACEFGGPRAWRSIHPEMEAVLDEDPLLYRVAPWLWNFCHCNGCVGLTRKKGRPPKYCSVRCKADADNARDRMRRRAAGAIPRNRKVAEVTA